MWYKKQLSHLAAMALLFVCPIVISAQENKADNRPADNPAAPARPVPALLPDALGGLKATGQAQQFSATDIGGLVGEKAPVYQEYLVVSASSRNYGPVRVDLFQTENPFAAYGLFSFSLSPQSNAQDVGEGGAWTEGGLVFWKGNYFVRVADADQRNPAARPTLHPRLAAAVAALIAPANPDAARPPLVGNLPGRATPRSVRYFLGPLSLAAYVEGGADMFGFAGDAEAIVAEYDQAAPSPLKLIIAEYHTPQFAADAIARVNSYLESLSESERGRIMVEREGNYIVQAINVEDPGLARELMDSVEYPYTVKWLRDPLLPTNDPFQTQKAAQMLISTFGLLGLILMTVLAVGVMVGATIFLKRRKQQQEIFSDAGGMLRLDLDPIEAALLSLPPKKE